MRSSSPTTRAYLARVLRDGCRVTAAFTVLSAAFPVWWVLTPLVWAGAPSDGGPSVALPLVTVVAVWVQSAALRRRALRG